MRFIKLIRNTWFLLIFLFFFSGIIWVSFQFVYKKDLFLLNIYKSNEPPNTLQVMRVYNTMMKSLPSRNNLNSFCCLAKILTRIGKDKETIKVLSRLIKFFPENRSLRLWLAVELQNQQRYKEAEKHFAILLRKKGKN